MMWNSSIPVRKVKNARVLLRLSRYVYRQETLWIDSDGHRQYIIFSKINRYIDQRRSKIVVPLRRKGYISGNK